MHTREVVRRWGLLDEDAAARFCREGHFVYESGRHGDLWLALGLLFAEPRRLRRSTALLAGKLRPYAPELICGALSGGALVGQLVAGEAAMFAERVSFRSPSAIWQRCMRPPQTRRVLGPGM